jgi:hypothetical protein
LLTVFAAGCSSSTTNGPLDKDVTGFAVEPFVTNVAVPSVIHSGSSFNLVFTLELAEGTDVQWLAGADRPFAPADVIVEQSPGGGGTITIFPFRDPSYADGTWTEPTRDVTYPVPALAAGTYTLEYYAAAARDEATLLGGFHFPYFQVSDIAPQCHLFTQQITVSP